MEDLRTERLAAETILQRGVKVKARAPLLLRLVGIKRITLRLRQPMSGTMLRVSSYYLRTGITSEQLDNVTTEQAMAIMAVHGKSIRRAVATAIINDWLLGRWFVRPVAWYLQWHLSEETICTLMDILVTYGGLKPFMTTTRYIRGMRLTSPNLGQKKKGS